MRANRDRQSLSYPLRLPDDIQADALRLLDTSREVINLTVTRLWDRLDEFARHANSYAYKQMEEMIAPPVLHGHRQWRCEAERAGRILRGQAERKQQFAFILSLLEQGMIIPKSENKRRGKNRKAIREALTQLRDAQTDGGNAVELQSLIESEEALPVLRREIARCWRKYQARNNDLAHVAATILLVLSTAFDCELIAGESLKSMKSAGRGRGAKRRWRNWRNNSQVRGELWRILRYKCFLAGVRLEWQQPRGTSHTCPRCGESANTSASPEHRSKINDWGAWLCCSNPVCLWNGSRDYAASLNIARLGTVLIRHAQTSGRVMHPSTTHPSLQPVSYMGTRAALRLPPLATRGHLIAQGRIYCNGWRLSVKLRSSYATPIMLRLCG